MLELRDEDRDGFRNLWRIVMRDTNECFDAKIVMHLGLSARAVPCRVGRRLQKEAILRGSKFRDVLYKVDCRGLLTFLR